MSCRPHANHRDRGPSFLGLLLVGLVVSSGCTRPAESGQDALVVTRGDLVQRFLLSGELVSEGGTPLSVPAIPLRRTQIQWIADDGKRVEAGETVIEFDNGSFARDLEEKRLQQEQQRSALATRQAALGAERSQIELAVEQRKVELAKARLDAAVPAELLPRREHEERQLALAKAETALAKAEADVTAAAAKEAADLTKLRLELEKGRAEIAEAEMAIEALRIRAPAAGIFLVADHPWMGRKMRVGDQAWQGLTVAELPDFTRLSVRAQLSDVDHGRVEAGATVEVTVDAFPARPFAGTVASVGSVARDDVEGYSRRFFEVRITPAPGSIDPNLFRPGMSVKVQLLRVVEPDTLLVPRRALDLGARPVRALRADGAWVEVELGACNSQECAVSAGLAAGDRLALAPRGAG